MGMAMKEDRREKKYKLADDGSLTHLFFHTAKHLRKRASSAFGQQRVLSLLAENGPMSQKSVQEMLEIQAGSLSETCAKLVDKNLIEKRRDEKDKRNVILTLTKKGKVFLEEISEVKDQAAFQALNETERAQLRELLIKVNEHLCDQNNDGNERGTE